MIFDDLAPGDIFGEYAAIDGAPRSASVEARTPCLVASMSAAAFRDILQSEPAVTLALGSLKPHMDEMSEPCKEALSKETAGKN